MGLQRYRSDISDPPEPNGAVAHYARWMGGPTLAKVTSCPVARDLMPPRTVYVTGEPLTWTSLPAACTYRERTIRGSLTRHDNGWRFYPWAGQFAPQNLEVTVSYATVTADSVVDGDHADGGYISPDGDRQSFVAGRKRDIERRIRQSRAGRYRWRLRDALDWLREHDGDRDPWEGTIQHYGLAVRVFGPYVEADAGELQATYTLHLQLEGHGSRHRLRRLLTERHGVRWH